MSEHDSRHQSVRELLGSYVLGHLDPTAADAVRAHLDGCAGCRGELEEIAPVARRLDLVDPDAFASPPVPPPWLGERIGDQLDRERELRRTGELREQREAAARDRAGRRRRTLVAAAVLILVLGLGGLLGGLVGRATAPGPQPVPTEPIPLASEQRQVTVSSADLVAHTWGVELRIVARGFEAGETFRAAFRTEDGTLVPAGEFRGVGQDQMTCFLQSSVLREDVTEVVVTDRRGRTVLVSSL